jgi:hypothetical protein
LCSSVDVAYPHSKNSIADMRDFLLSGNRLLEQK